MNNLPDNQHNAKQAYLDNQLAKMLARYERADKTERAAIIRQVDGFLSALSGYEKYFWLSFRQKLERLSETDGFDLRRWYKGKIIKARGK